VRNFIIKKTHIGKRPAVAITIVSGLVLIGLMMFFAFRQLYNALPSLIPQVIAGVNEIRNWTSGPPLNISNVQFDEAWAQVQSFLVAGETISNMLTRAISAVGTLGNFLTMAIIMIFCTVFFLADGRAIWTWLINLLPLASREKVHQAGRRGAVTLSAYVRTQILVAAVDGVGIGLGMLFFVPAYALPIGVLVFMFAAVPIVGGIVSGAIATILVLVSRGWIAALIMLAIVLVVQQTESSILLPFLMGHAVSLHPVAVLLAVTGGVMVAGLAGALFAVPLVAVLNTMVQYLFDHDKFPELGDRDHLPLLRMKRLERTMADLRQRGPLKKMAWGKPAGANDSNSGQIS
jgi:predicted PurR-regulated permease PerM